MKNKAHSQDVVEQCKPTTSPSQTRVLLLTSLPAGRQGGETFAFQYKFLNYKIKP